MKPAWIVLSLLLQAACLALLVVLVVDREREVQAAGDGDVEDLVEEVSQARYQMQTQFERMVRLVDRWRREGAARAAADGDRTDGEAEQLKTPDEILARLLEVEDLHARYRWDPLQREPVEKERARLEELLRRAGDDAIDALAEDFPTLGEHLKDAQPGWVRTRLLTHVVDPIGSQAAADFAMAVFEDPRYNSGVRLEAAHVALKRYPDRVVERLVRLLAAPDPNFARREQIALYFKQNPDPRALEALTRVARDVDNDRLLRRMALDALGEYKDPKAVDALREVASNEAHGDLRGTALHSLNRILGEEILPFVEHLRETMAPDDPLQQLLDNIEALYRN